jgi:tyrosine-protein kinase Etk/Wzc
MEEVQKNKQISFSPREIVFKYLPYLPWVLVSMAILFFLAYIKLRYTTPMYSASGKLLVKKNSPYNTGGEKFDDIFMMQGGTNNLNDEIEIIKSSSIAARVVKSLGLQAKFFNKGNIRISEVHVTEFPFVFEIIGIKDSTRSVSFEFLVNGKDQFVINNNTTASDFGSVVDIGGFKFRLFTKQGVSELDFRNKQYIISWAPPEGMIAVLSSGIKVSQVNDFTNVLKLTYESENPRLGVDIINQFMQEYLKAGLEDKRLIALNTLAFIDVQLDTVKKELGGVERNLLNFRQSNKVINPEQQSQLFFSQLYESGKTISEQDVKLTIVDRLINYVGDKNNATKMVPSLLGIEEPSLLQQITEFNKLQLERETAIKTTKEDNPLIKNLDIALAKIRSDMLENLGNVRQTYLVALAALNKRSGFADSQIKGLPAKEKQLLEVARQQKILEELYSYLLQKKLETSISSASTISSVKVLESAMSSGGAISPNRSRLFMLALVAGLLIPVAIIFLKEYLNDKIRSRSDIEKVTSTPIIGEVGHSEDALTLVAKANNRSFVAEQFRIIRTNLQYMMHKVEKPVILVTSSFSGEGKSFVSTNIGAVMALANKKTVILEFDIRKPKIVSGLNLSRSSGITNFIVGRVSLDELIVPIPEINNLFVIPCGPVPPNPAELLLDEKIGEMFNYLKRQFDVIIIDTAPAGLVSDAIVLGKFADVTLYITRQSYTLKRQLHLIDDFYVNKKLPGLSLILNDVEMTSGGYGYGYGYGYSNYHEVRKKKSFFEKMQTLFGFTNNRR